MKHKTELYTPGVQELCRKLKGQLDELSIVVERKPKEEDVRRRKLMEELKRQLAELSR